MILFEGIDCVGKSEGALALRDALGWSYRHFTNPNNLGGCYLHRMSFLADAHPEVVLDRFHLGDYAYEICMRGAVGMSEWDWRIMELALMSRGCSVVWMTDALESVRDRWNQAREMYDFDDMIQVSRLYQQVFSEADGVRPDAPGVELRTKLPWAQFTLPELLCKLPLLAGQWAVRAEKAARLPAPSSGIGSVKPEFVIVGDCQSPGPGPDDRPDVPFGRGPAASWLWRAAEELKLRWWEGYYTLASSWTGAEFGHLVDRCLGPSHQQRRLVAMGDRSADLLFNVASCGWARGCSTFRVMHPSWSSGRPILKVTDGREATRQYCRWRAQLAMTLEPWCRADRVGWALETADEQDVWDLGMGGPE